MSARRFTVGNEEGLTPYFLTYGSVCSGIEAASVAWAPLGWRCAFVAEIDPFARAVLAHHYPDVPNVGDFTKIGADDVGAVDLIVGGTPCQDFSVAGLRAGMDGKRGQLTIEFVRLADRLRPRWLVWENVPGVLSIDDGRAFGIFLGLLGGLGYGLAYRVLDAQYAGVPQRRRRVFVVGHLGDFRRAAAVLFERASLSGHPAPRRQTRQVTPTLTSSGAGVGRVKGAARSDDAEWFSAYVDARDEAVAGTGNTQDGFVVAHALTGEGHDASEDGTGRGVPLVFDGAQVTSAVRRLTPRECERLQGFPDDYTLVPYRGKPAADGPRYRSLGNSFAVPVVRWIGERIALVEALAEKSA